MKTLRRGTAPWVLVCTLSLSLPVNLQAWEPNAKDLEAAIHTGDFNAYFNNITAWLNRKTPADPAKISEATLKGLLKDPVFANTLDQRQFLAKYGVDALGAFAKDDQANRTFLAWVLKNTQVMDLYLEAAAPSRDKQRELNTHTLGIGSLDLWKQLYTEDPDSREGPYLRLAMATALWPPRGTSYGSGLPIDPISRYKHYKAAHQNKELFPSFDKLLVWDYGKVLNSWASDSDLAWARQMLNTWRPDLRDQEQVAKIVSEVWRRNSPFPFSNGFPTVMEGGGKCGPRAFFGVMICQAFGIPAIGIGQPGHACFGAKTAYPELEPQPGSVWKVYQGRGWEVSDCGDAMYGPEFLSEVTKRYRVAEFSLIEHLRWLASALSTEERADAVRKLAGKIRKPVNTTAPLGVPAKDIDPIPEDPSSAPAATTATSTPAPLPEEPLRAVPGVIRVEAAAFTNSFAEPAYPDQQKGCVYVYDCFTGGKQVNFQKNMTISWLEYSLDVPETGTYGLEVLLAAANRDQVLDISCGTEKLGTVKIPSTLGLWKKTPPVDVELKKGKQTLRISAPLQRGVAIRWFTLTPKEAKQ